MDLINSLIADFHHAIYIAFVVLVCICILGTVLVLFWRILLLGSLALFGIVAFLKATGQEDQHVRDGLASVAANVAYVASDATTVGPVVAPAMDNRTARDSN